MILVELQLHNYKQYAGEHRIEFRPQGTVAVIGANGVGKTTLFEAIEWCLYNPREISNDEVPPRGGVGHTLVRLMLEDPRDGLRYVIERGLKRGTTTAELYREDRPELPIVQGTRQVTDYVSRRLIGLGHRAFVSTFFTRQKELNFFGGLKETERRREVARLLGFDTIRAAQTLIGEERNHARAEALSLQLNYDEQASGHDFPSEIEAAEAAIARQEEIVAAAHVDHANAVTTHVAAREDLERWRELERQENALRQELARVQGDARAAAARRDEAATAIARLEVAAAECATLAPIAATVPERTAAIAGFERERDRDEHQARLAADLARAERAGREIADHLGREISALGPAAGLIEGWTWHPADNAEPIAGAERILTVIATLDVAGTRATATALAECRRLVERRDETRVKARRYQERFNQLERDVAALRVAGDPEAAVTAARQAREAAVHEMTEAQTRAKTASTERARYTPLIAALREQRFGERCPTCGRQFSANEAALTLTALVTQQQALRDQGEREQSRHEAARGRADAAAQAEASASERRQELVKLTGSIESGRPQVEEVEADRLVAEEHLIHVLAAHGLGAEPTNEAVTAAETRAGLFERVAGLGRIVTKLRDDGRRAAAEAAAAQEALAILGPVLYDRAAHEAARAALQTAHAAATRIARIEEELAHLPDYRASHAAATTELAHLADQRTAIETARAALGFTQAALDTAIAAEKAANTAERTASERVMTAQQILRDALRERDQCIAAQTRLHALGERAATRTREADELDRMYREFNHFDQYVALHVTPRLADHTGELLGAVTDGKYAQVKFDDNYGLSIYDEEECFPLESFSGGERDVAALCARLALSRLIGAQAAHPPRFLVLDEVFGSLDQERRTHVLDALATLTSGSEIFRQVFIISHVEDVRYTGIVDEVWRVNEIDGVSHVENLTRVGSWEEM